MITDTTVHEHSMSNTTDEHSNGGRDTETTAPTAATADSATASAVVADGTGATSTVLSEAAYKEAREAANSVATFTCDTPVMMHYTMYPEPARTKQVTVKDTAAATNTTGRCDGTQTSGNSDSNTAATTNATGTAATAISGDATASGSSVSHATASAAATANAASTTATAATSDTAAVTTAISAVEDPKADDTLSDSDDDMSIDDNESDTPAEPEPPTAVELHQQQLAISESTNNSGTVSVATAAGTTVPTVRLLRHSTRDVADAAATATAASFTAVASATDATAAVHDDDAMSECRSVADDTVHSSSGTSHAHKQKRKRDSDPAQMQEEDRSAKGLWEKGAKKRVKHVQRYEVDADLEVTAVLQKCQLNPSQLKVVKRFMDDAYSNDPALHLVQGWHTYTICIYVHTLLTVQCSV
jgi:hypothetical protein